MKPKLLLASGSPRRIQLLKQAGFQLKIIKPDVNEDPLSQESPLQLVKRLSRSKAAAALAQAGSFSGPLIAADTIVVLNKNKILGKPKSAADAFRMLKRIAGREHEVFTGFTALRIQKGRVLSAHTQVVKSRVWIRPLRPQEIRDYIRTGEPMDKAGAYAAQGIGMGLVERIIGSYTNVVGLPVTHVLAALERWN